MKRKAYDGIYNQYIKRGIDFCLALVGLIIAAIPMAIVAVAIKAESKGPVIFKQDRIGYKGKVYKMYKFRSMCVGAEKGGVYSDNKDSRVTKVGKFIRATSIDELPQLVNVLKGDMALIGFRSPLTYHPWPWSEYTEEQKKMFNVRPGITGWAQVNGRKTVEWNKRIELNGWYAEHVSFWLDVKILFMTALLVIVVAIKSKRTTEALLIGCVSSYLIIATANKSNPVTLMVDSFFKVVTDYDTVWLLIVCGLFGSLIAVINAARGTHAIANFLGKICKTDKSTLLTSWILGIIIFVDDYMNIMTISACTKKLSDSRKVPREALAYVIDSTGAPVCVLLPFSTWAIFFAGIFWEQSEIVDLGYGSAMATYIHAIPYMFYALVALIIVPLFIFGVIPKLGAMKSAYKRVEETGQVYSKESQKWNKNGNEEVDKEAKIVDFLFPILTMIIVQLTVGDMFIAIIAAILAAGIIYIPRKKMRTNQFCDLWVQGFADSVSALVIIVAALWMRQASADINLPNYVMSVVEPFVNANIYPMVAFVVVAMLGFITGSNWGIPAVCAPIIIPLGAACGANLLIVIAAIVCGGTFCSHACFYSDATVITSSSCGIENMEHVYSQLPYTMIAAGIASILFLIAGFIF